MKRLIVLLCAALMLIASLTGCMTEAGQNVKEAASEVASGVKKAATEVGIDDHETRRLTEATQPTTGENVGEMIEDNVNSMLENGEVEDGDGNVGDLENNDGDGYVDEKAAE